MNVWWPVLIVLSLAWVIPMLGARHANIPWPFFVAVGCMWAVVCVFVRPLYDFGIRTRRKMGMTKLADWGERVRPRILPPARVALVVMALLSFLFAFL
jgi:hypothetical protein